MHRMHAVLGLLLLALPTWSQPNLINDKVYQHMASQFGSGFAMFQHFSVNTFACADPDRCTRVVEHNCFGAPNRRCLSPDIFNPTNLNTTQWVETAQALGADEICLTAHHEGGFALWPTGYQSYSVKASPWRQGRGDVVKEFAASARQAGLKICYYIGPNANGFLLEQGYNISEFVRRQKGMFAELLTEPAYGPVHRFWIDHPFSPCHDDSEGRLPEWTMCPPGGWDGGQNPDTFPLVQLEFNALVAQLSPATIMGGAELWNGPVELAYPLWSFCNISRPGVAQSGCGTPGFSSESSGSTFGPNGGSYRPQELTNSILATGAQWFGAQGASARPPSELWRLWMDSVGVGGGMILNVPPSSSGQIEPAWVASAAALGTALRRSWSKPVATLLSRNVTLRCASNPGAANSIEVALPNSKEWNAVRTAEDVYHARQTIAGYRIEISNGTVWQDVTVRGGSVGLGVIDLLSESVRASTMRWSCLSAAALSTPVATLTQIELYFATPPK